jgi:hypothetical protein
MTKAQTGNGRDRGAHEPGAEFLKEFRAFVAFLQNLWGLLAGVSVFFPLSNLLLEAIPLQAYGEEGGVYNHLSPPLITTTATIVTLFVLLSTFMGRGRLREKKGRQAAVHNAWVSFGVSILFLIAYVIFHQVYAEYAWAKWGWGSGDPRKLFAEVLLLMSYVAFFSLLTRAFVLLGMIEFFGARMCNRLP